MEESPKSSLESDLAVKLTDLLKELDGEGDGELTEFTVKEELIEEVMQELYKEITCATTTTASNISTTSVPANFPLQSPLMPVVAVSDGGKSESCGVSVSDSTSTVMAGIGPIGTGKKKFGSQGIKIGFEFDHGMMMNGCDGEKFDDDEWLARVLGWDPQELDD